MIPQNLAARLLEPLWRIFPKGRGDDDYLELATLTLAKGADDPTIGSATVDRLVETCRYKPLPVEILEAVEYARSQVEVEQVPEEWKPVRNPDDQPFHGLSDLIDDRVLELLARKAESGLTHAEREAAREYLRVKTADRAPLEVAR